MKVIKMKRFWLFIILLFAIIFPFVWEKPLPYEIGKSDLSGKSGGFNLHVKGGPSEQFISVDVFNKEDEKVGSFSSEEVISSISEVIEKEEKVNITYKSIQLNDQNEFFLVFESVDNKEFTYPLIVTSFRTGSFSLKPLHINQ